MKPKSVLEQLANQYTLPGGSFYMDEQGTIQTVENIADLKKYLMIKGATQVIFVKSIDRFVESDSSGVADEVTSWASTHPKRKGYRWVLQAVATASSSVAPYMDFNKEGGGTVRLTFGSAGQPIYTILSCLMLLFSSITGYAQSASTSPLIDQTTHVLAWPSDLWTTNAAAIAAAIPSGSLGTNQLNAQTYGLLNSRSNPNDTSLWPDIILKDDGNGLIYVRMPWSVDKDLRLSIYRVAANNGIVDFNNADLIGVDELITTTNTVKIGDMTDEFCPFRTAFQGTLDGGHLIEINKVTKSGHGLTTADVGKTWNIQNGRICALWSVSGDDFYLVWRKYTSGTATDVTAAQSTITSMTPFSTGGSTEGPAVDVTGATVAKVELINSCTNVTTEFLVNGITQLVSGELTPAKSFVISCRRQIIDPREWYYRCTNSVGTQIDLLAGSKFFNRRSDIVYYPWGQIYLKEVLECTSAITVGLGNTGIPLQKAVMPAFSGVTSRFWWIPDTVGLTPDVSSPVAFSSLGASMFAYDTNWVDGLPPDLFVQFGSSSTNLSSDSILASSAVIYDPEYFDTVPSVRSERIRGPGRSAFEIRSSTLKMYPSSYFPAYSNSVYSAASAVGDTLLTAGSHVHSPAPDEGLILKAITKTEKSWLIYFGWNSALGVITPTVPTYLQNLPCTSFRASGGSLVSSSTSGTITINASSAVGYLIVKIGE